MIENLRTILTAFLKELAARVQEPGGEFVVLAGATAAVVLLFLGLSGLIYLAVRARRTPAQQRLNNQLQSESEDNQLAEIKGRLTAMSEIWVQRQSEQARNLDDRLDHITDRLASQLDGMSRRVAEGLSETNRSTGETVARMNERVDTLSQQLAQTLEGATHRLGENVSESERRTNESIALLNERLAVIADAKQSLADLSSEVISLQSVLADKQARGAFGQIRMETIIRDALPQGSYEFQPTLSNGRRPDCVIYLPNTQAPLVVDSKFPLEGFEALRQARGSEALKSANKSIRDAVARHIADIAEKYLLPGETQDTALMFVPSESVYGDLHEHFSDLVQQAHRARIVIVAPNILMLAVQTVQAVIKDAKMRDQAGLIQREVGTLLDDVRRLVERVSELERHFGLSTKALEKITQSAAKIEKRGERVRSLELEETPPENTRENTHALGQTQLKTSARS